MLTQASWPTGTLTAPPQTSIGGLGRPLASPVPANAGTSDTAAAARASEPPTRETVMLRARDMTDTPFPSRVAASPTSPSGLVGHDVNHGCLDVDTLRMNTTRHTPETTLPRDAGRV